MLQLVIVDHSFSASDVTEFNCKPCIYSVASNGGIVYKLAPSLKMTPLLLQWTPAEYMLLPWVASVKINLRKIQHKKKKHKPTIADGLTYPMSCNRSVYAPHLRFVRLPWC